MRKTLGFREKSVLRRFGAFGYPWRAMLGIALLSALIGYLLGTLAPSYWLGRLLKGIDIREHNFRNAGTRNTKATLGLGPAIVTAVIDTTKGVGAVLIATRGLGLQEGLIFVPAVAAVVGHIFPFHLGFRGGKGSATAIGVFIYNSVVEIVRGSFTVETFIAILLVALIIYLASRSGEVAGMVTFTFMVIVTPLDMGLSGPAILNMALSAFLTASITRTAIRRGIFAYDGPEELKIWRLVARPFALLFVLIDALAGRTVVLIVMGAVSVVFITLDLVRMISRKEFSTFLFKKKEAGGVSSMTGFLVASVLSFILFPGPIPYLAMGFITIGDLFSKLVGIRFGRRKLIGGKTLEGSLAFFAGCIYVGYVLALLFPLPLWYVPAGAALAAATELFSFRVDDNFTVSLVSGGILTALRRLI